MNIGYTYLIDQMGLKVAGKVRPAIVDRRVQAVVSASDSLRVPISMAIENDDPIAHLVFAIKHQGIHLEAIQAISARLSQQSVQQALNANPNGKYARIIGFLYEQFTGKELAANVRASAYVDLFDEAQYVTGSNRRNRKFKVNQNGLGDFDFCPTIRRTPELEQLLRRDLFADLASFVERVGGPRNLDRALGWAYLSETRSSFDIEGESLSEDKAQRFVQLLHQAHHAQDLTERYLAELQSGVISNPFLQEPSFRRKQNWLQKAARHVRASNVIYIPPAPEHNLSLMQGLLHYANAPYPSNSREALLKSLMVSFGFVFNHPFLDGNGRISRFLIHHGLCRAGLVKEGLILPISVAFQQHEGEYLNSLESVSAAIRKLWKVNEVTDRDIDATLMASGDPYRYWDGTLIAQFGLRMAHYALDHTLVEEVKYLERFDCALARINNQYDISNKDAMSLIRMIVSEEGRLSMRRRKQFSLVVTAEVLNDIEKIVRDSFYPNSAHQD